MFNDSSNSCVLRSPSLIFFSNRKAINTFLKETKLLTILSHSDERCIVSCLVVNTLMYNIIYNKEYNVLKFRTLLSNRTDRIDFDKYTLFETLDECELDGINWNGYFYNRLDYCFKTMAVAIWAYKNLSKGFKEIIVDIALQGGDADNNCAIAGCIIGAFIGFKRFPPRWLDTLKYKDCLEDICKEYMENEICRNPFSVKK